MPLHIRKPEKSDSDTHPLVQALADELMNPGSTGQPVVLEDASGRDDAIRVHVIWDRWSECPRVKRSRVIERAYEQAFGSERRNRITLALPVTPQEAKEIGLLPYQVMPARASSNGAKLHECEALMKQTGGVFLSDDPRPQLRFPTLEDAELALGALQAENPKSKWIIVKDVTPYED